MSGRFEADDGKKSIFPQCNMKEEIIRQSEFYSRPAASHSPMLLLFDINEDDNRYYFVCLNLKELLYMVPLSTNALIIMNSITTTNRGILPSGLLEVNYGFPVRKINEF